MLKRSCTRVFLLIIFVCAAFGQSEVGGATLSGTVTDPSGAAVASAKVTATSKQTGFSVATTTNETGLYNLVRLPVGSYDLTVDAKGFQPIRRTEIPLTIGAVLTLDVQLQFGTAHEIVS